MAIPVPLALGHPGEGYPWSWSICRWLEGESAQYQHTADLSQAARDLADFIAALQRLDVVGWPSPGPPDSPRGVPLSPRDASTRAAIAELSGRLDTGAVTLAWESALQEPAWYGLPAWTHGDLLPGNLLVQQGRINTVIDFGCLRVGDPARDLVVAWSLLSTQTRGIFRAELSVDEAAWGRGRG